MAKLRNIETPRQNLISFIVGDSGLTSADEGKPCKMSATADQVETLLADDDMQFVIDKVDVDADQVICKGPGEIVKLGYTGTAPTPGIVHLVGSATIGKVVAHGTPAFTDILRHVIAVDTTNSELQVIL